MASTLTIAVGCNLRVAYSFVFETANPTAVSITGSSAR
jgi:hypothetical protein